MYNNNSKRQLGIRVDEWLVNAAARTAAIYNMDLTEVTEKLYMDFVKTSGKELIVRIMREEISQKEREIESITRMPDIPFSKNQTLPAEALSQSDLAIQESRFKEDMGRYLSSINTVKTNKFQIVDQARAIGVRHRARIEDTLDQMIPLVDEYVEDIKREKVSQLITSAIELVKERST